MHVRILIDGAGIVGLAAAAMLRARGFCNVTIFEQAGELQEAGAGVQVTPNGTKIIRRLGLLDELTKVAVMPLATKVDRMRRHQGFSAQ